MTWNISSEVISIIVLCIIWTYAKKGNPLPTLRNKLFQMCFFTTFCAISSNITSTFLIYHYAEVPLWLNWTVTMIYFIATPLMGVVYFYYTVSVIGSNKKYIKKMITWGSIPAIIYLLVILTNPFNKLIFDINLTDGYVRGPYIFSTYIIFYVYCLICIIIPQFSGTKSGNSEKKILSIFPIIAVMVIFVQQLIPNYTLSGSAATCALLLIYLYLENKHISIDYLTKLPNRQVFLEMINLKINKKKPDHFTIIILSLKEFKQINSKLGQDNGNLCLQAIAEFLKKSCKNHQLYRFSGDEFAILIEDTSPEKTKLLINQLYERMLSPWNINNYSQIIYGGIGVVESQPAINSTEAIITGLEYAVVAAKHDPMVTCVYCTSEMVDQANRRNKIIEILKYRIARNNLEIYYQPILDVNEQKFLIAEALLRLKNTSLGSISPNEFIPIAENTGLIIPITYQVIEKVCQFIRKLLDQGVDFKGISINISAVQFSDDNFSDTFLEIIKRNNVPYSMIKVEITEGTLISNFDKLKEFMTKMHNKGILFGLDDFGTGYSNIASVVQLPWDTIKLDKSLIWAAIENDQFALMVKTLANAFSILGVRILTEGIETKEQRDFAISIKCNMIQGFLYTMPLCSTDAENFIGKKLSDNIAHI